MWNISYPHPIMRITTRLQVPNLRRARPCSRSTECCLTPEMEVEVETSRAPRNREGQVLGVRGMCFIILIPYPPLPYA